MGSECWSAYVCACGVCVLRRTEPHGVLALLTHHMQDQSHQQQSAVGELVWGRKE